MRKLITGGTFVGLVGLYIHLSLEPEQDLASSVAKDVSSNQESVRTGEQFPLNRNNPQPTAPKLFGDLRIIDAETIEIDFNADALSVAPTLLYLDPMNGDLLESAPTRTLSNVASETLVSSVEINGTRRPLTITIADNTVFMTLPYTGGVLTGEGSRSSITLKKQKPMKDFVKDEVLQPEALNKAPLKEIPVCLNC